MIFQIGFLSTPIPGLEATNSMTKRQLKSLATLEHKMNNKAVKSMPVLVGIAFGTLMGIAAVFIPFLFDAIRFRSLTIAIIGCGYFVAIIALLLSAIIRIVGALLSQRIRSTIALRPIAHAIWFAAGLGIIIGLLIIMLFGPAKANGF
jgi:hypothetical protein